MSLKSKLNILANQRWAIVKSAPPHLIRDSNPFEIIIIISSYRNNVTNKALSVLILILTKQSNFFYEILTLDV